MGSAVPRRQKKPGLVSICECTNTIHYVFINIILNKNIKIVSIKISIEKLVVKIKKIEPLWQGGGFFVVIVLQNIILFEIPFPTDCRRMKNVVWGVIWHKTEEGGVN